MTKFHACLLCLILIQQARSLICPAGSYKSLYNDKCYTCPTGSFCPGDNSRITCKSGYYAEHSGSTSCKICPVGHRCYYVDNAPVKCTRGQYQDQTGQRSCKWCNSGEYSIDTGRTTKCDICPVGHRCYYVDTAPVKCPKGKYQNQMGQTSCKRCKSGEYNIEIGRSRKCEICPLGHYCSFIERAPVKCPRGEYQNQMGKTSCKRCKAGEYNIEIGRSRKCEICPLGHYCYFIDRAPVKCAKGHYQDQMGQTSCKRCKSGEYNIETGRSRKCEICPLGHYCYFIDRAPVKCAKGHYQDQMGKTSCKRCKAGEYNIEIGRSRKCEICPLGHYCSFIDRAPVKCAKGHYQDQMGQTSCKRCKSGEYNIETGRSRKCEICPLGHYCSFIDRAPVKCAKGHYQDQMGQTSCKRCKAGQYNIQTGSTTCESCPAGSKCIFIDMIPLPCKEGEYSPAESTKCFSCPSGSFCPSRSTLPVALNNDTVLKSQIHRTVKYAAEAYKDKNDPALNGLRLINNDSKIQGYVKFQDNAIVVSFRGTVDLKDWISNAKVLQRDYQNCKSCKVHTGFFNYYNSVHLQMLTKVSALSHAHPNSKVIVTGHSLGGAQATLAAVDLIKAGYDTDLITYGSPRVGNKQFSEYVDKTLKGLNLRVTYKNDVVTVTPPQSRGYWHVGQEMHYTDQNTAFKLPPKMDVNYNRLSFGDHRMVNYERLN